MNDPTGAPLDPNRTQSLADANRTQMLGDSNRTQMVSPPSNKALAAEVVAGRECALANSPAREAFLFEVTGAGSIGDARTPLNLCMVIDRSGSMEGEPLEYVKRACAYVIDLLAPDDIVSIVTFEEAVEVLMPPARVQNKDLVKQHIQRIEPGNTTNLYDGLSFGAQQVLATQDPSRVERIVVFTDGEPTAGVKDFQSLVAHVGDIKQRGVTCTFLGFGYDYNEELLAAMAKRAGGNYYFINKPEAIPEIFRVEMNKLMTTVARNVELRLKAARWVTIRQAYGHNVQPGQQEATLGLADVERGTTMQAAVELEFQNHPLGQYRVLAATLSWDDALTGKREAMDLDCIIEFTADQQRCSAPQNPRVAQSVEVSLATRVVEKTMMGLKAGELTAQMAIQELQKTQMLLQQDGRAEEAAQVAQAVRDLQQGKTGDVEKTLIGTITQLDQGKKSQS
ncbi:MAG: VWA domain-containing protein [Armatimonadota bacterium]